MSLGAGGGELMPGKPSYSTTRMQIRLNTALAWLVILGLVAGALLGEPQAVAIAREVISWMVILIMGLLGIHRFAGALDMRAALDAQKRDDAPQPQNEGDNA